MKQIKAFTLLEMLVVIILSSVIIGLGYTAIDWFSKLYNSYKQREQESHQIINFVHLIEQQFQNSNWITTQEQFIYFEKKKREYIAIST